MSAVDEATRALLRQLIANVQREDNRKDVEYMLEHIVPLLLPAITHLLQSVEANEARMDAGDQNALPIKPIDHLAKYLLRNNPRYNEPVSTLLQSSMGIT
ncbi:TPA: hypothetical protein N0F65_006539 [Lagenidium giganteum]|uniref:Uncharacterized protein n=1 Tax=Lagenidium giganteum TaxID=4803 RepID=A0AAV2YHZ7_9STRA|nr:TPA: hypothetical protein N0F65_006539 [Lagenidium giganteum]